jgi:hypothetical protein
LEGKYQEGWRMPSELVGMLEGVAARGAVRTEEKKEDDQ